MSEFGKFLKKLRHNRNMSLRDVEKVAKLSNSYLSQLENGSRGIPTLKTMQKIAVAYGTTVEELTKIANNTMKKTTHSLPKADFDFICRTYSELSDESKKSVQDFINFLCKQDQKGISSSVRSEALGK